MRITRIHTDQPLMAGATVDPGREAARHLVTVLRLKAGDPVCLFNGEGGEYRGTITSVSGKSVMVELTGYDPQDRESPLRTVLGVGLSRGERFEWVLQKATELGVTEIAPLYTERTEVKLRGEREDKKLARWQQVLAGACEQCGRNRPPLLRPPVSLDAWLGIDCEQKIVLHHRATTSLARLAGTPAASVALLVGPEGGLSPGELEAAEHSGFQSLAIGPRIFRTETAPLVALTLFQSLWGDFNSAGGSPEERPDPPPGAPSVPPGA